MGKKGKGGGLKGAIKKTKEAVKGAGKEVKKVTKDVGKGVQKTGEKTVKAAKKAGQAVKHPFDVIKTAALKGAGLPSLLPLVPVMVVGLRAKGIKNIPLTKPYQIAGLFIKHVIGANRSHLEHLSDTATDEVFKAAEGMAAGAVPGGGIAVKVVHLIVDFIKGNKKKADAKKLEEIEKNKAASPEAIAEMKEELVLTPEEKKATASSTTINDVAYESDKIQDTLVKGGIGNVDSKNLVKEPEKPASPTDEQIYGKGFWGRIRKLLKIKKKEYHIEEGGEEFLESIEDYQDEEAAPSKQVNEPKEKEFVSKPIDTTTKTDKKVISPLRSFMNRISSSHKAHHLESLEHAEGKCDC